MNSVRRVLAMKDSSQKLMKLADLMLRVDYLSPLWYRLDAESRRLLDAGFWYLDDTDKREGKKGKRNV